MINEQSVAAVDARRWTPHFIRPLYEDYAFAQIPQTIRYLLTEDTRRGVPFGAREDLGQQVDTVILFFVDAFGWRFLSRWMDRHPFLQRIVREGLVNKLTSQFPSTTAAHVTAMHTGSPVGQSGVYEWYYYEPILDEMIAPLLFSFAGDHDRDTLRTTGVQPEALYPTHTVYQDLRNHGVQSWVFQDYRYAHSPYTRVAANGATIAGYRTLSEAIVTMSQLLERQAGKAYYYLYFDALDSICHLYGPNSLQLEAEIETFLDIMERLFHRLLSRQRGRVLFLMTADHGQAEVDPASTVYLNRSLPQLLELLKTNRRGKLLVPAGSARDLFLHIQEPYLAEAVGMLREHLEGKADVYRVDELIDQGFFGHSPSAALLGRVGDLVILPYEHQSVWWYEQGRFEQLFHGHHGGPTPAEMETILLAYRYEGARP